MPKYLSAALAALLAAPAAAQPFPPVRPADPTLNPVPTDAFAFVSVKVSRLWDNPAAKPVRDWVAAQKDAPLDRILGVPPADLDRVTLFAPTLRALDRGEPLVLATTRKPYNEARVLKALGVGGGDPRGQPAKPGGRVFPLDGPFGWVALVDDRTLLFVPERLPEDAGPALLAQLVGRKGDGPLAQALLAAQVHDLTVGVDVRALAGEFADRGAGADRRLAPYLPLLRARSAAVVADFDKTARVRFVMNFPDADAARKAAPALEEGLNAVAADLVGPDGPQADPARRLVFGWAATVLKGAKVTAAGTDVTAAADAPYADEVAKLAAVLPKSLGIVRGNAQATNNLKQLGVGMHNFHSAYNHFPGDAFGGQPKAPAMSWRVQILPFLEQDNLFRQLDLQKPWDDPNNLKVLEAMEMPKVFEHPGRPAPKGHTYFRAFSFPKGAKGNDRPALAEGERGPRVADFTDGLSNTFLVVEAGEAVPWYKPDVLAYDGKLPLPPLGDKDADRFLALMGDGSVRAVSRKTPEQTLRALITRAGGEVVPIDDK
ncbi:MAG: hypothetical protein C0501_01610 [Isosphaera sp.]|nr:hypothetical protein [Isosphaera sp.]